MNISRSRRVQNWVDRIAARGEVSSDLIEEAEKDMNKLEKENIHVDIGYVLYNLTYRLNQRFGQPSKKPTDSYAKACKIIREEIPEQLEGYSKEYAEQLKRTLMSPKGLNIIIQLNEDIKNSTKFIPELA